MSHLQPAPDFSNSADLHLHYAGVRARLNRRRPLPSVLPLLLTYQPKEVAIEEQPEFIETHTVVDVVPRQRLALPQNTKLLVPEAENIAIRRAITIYLRLVFQRPIDGRLDMIKRAVSIAFKINREVLTHTTRGSGAVRVRQIGIAMAHRFTLKSLSEIGHAFGGRDHTTVLYAARKMARSIDDVIVQMFDGQSCTLLIHDAASLKIEGNT